MVLFGVIIYMLVMVGIGWWSSRKIKDSTDYIVAGRRLPLFFTIGTLFATWFCAGTLMGATAQAYLFGNQGVIFDSWGAALCLIPAGIFFVRMMRRGGYLTLVDFFDIRYGKKMGIAASIVLALPKSAGLEPSLLPSEQSSSFLPAFPWLTGLSFPAQF
ncbi:MAG: sodium:solute symporter family transporter [Bacillota bacterium]